MLGGNGLPQNWTRNMNRYFVEEFIRDPIVSFVRCDVAWLCDKPYRAIDKLCQPFCYRFHPVENWSEENGLVRFAVLFIDNMK
jgi:hypothetical protein